MRSSFEIIAEILRAARNGAKTTRIMHKCGLGYSVARRYATLLLEKDLLRIGDSYHPTDKGMQFLQNYQTMELLLNTRT